MFKKTSCFRKKLSQRDLKKFVLKDPKNYRKILARNFELPSELNMFHITDSELIKQLTVKFLYIHQLIFEKY